MKIINRKMETSVITTEMSQTAFYCQASFNSDGVITLRNYNITNRNCDEIIILSAEETQAIFQLFSKIGRKIKNLDLPF